MRVAAAPDPLWEITNSLDRLQTSEGRWAFAPWYQETRAVLDGSDLKRTVRNLLIPLLPRAAYFPDFLTPSEGREGLDAGLDAILRTPRSRVIGEIRKLAHLHRAPEWGPRVADGDLRAEIAAALRDYHQQIIAPQEDSIQAAVDGDRAQRARAVLDGGIHRLLDSFRPGMRWCPPVLEMDYPVRRDVHLGGAGLTLVPSYFCWKYPVALADPDLPPVLIYPLVRTVPAGDRRIEDLPATALIGTTRSAVLRATAHGMTTGEIARQAGVGAATASHHLNVLRDSNLITSHRRANTVLHVLTPLGAALLRGKR
ncbi:ArsR/SmtB family transcription factor [Amycolatopsis sp. H20-H5]|uniref:ArsR/SmtB family transcription factor n=1 Tax=Amycolatopsis sp. H20-H5 TaxID=3046309 RepID=UPI002DB75D4C|nr:winged helix-turn-helix domain-containing protein [Amycolatopsis sp. H20-H5]MEC3980812.1 winged helix-turn-helix domain-containing protein [Amycolatopsis sp. H20-H5]